VRHCADGKTPLPVAARLIKRFGLSTAVRWGALACVVSLLRAISALGRDGVHFIWRNQFPLNEL